MTAQTSKVWASLGAAVLAIAAGVFAVEGGYSNNPADPGGETNHGVTVAVARSHGYDGPMREMPKETAQQTSAATWRAQVSTASSQSRPPWGKSWLMLA